MSYTVTSRGVGALSDFLEQLCVSTGGQWTGPTELAMSCVCPSGEFTENGCKQAPGPGLLPPPGRRPPTPAEIAFCRETPGATPADVLALVVEADGNLALDTDGARYCLNETGCSEAHGTWLPQLGVCRLSPQVAKATSTSAWVPIAAVFAATAVAAAAVYVGTRGKR